MQQNATPAVATGGHREFIASDWKPLEKNTLRGFFTIILPSGMRLRECSLHARDGSRWIGLPTKTWTKRDGSTAHTPLVDFVSDDALDRFGVLALAAIDKLLGRSQ